MINFRFNIKKATQAAALFLELNDNRLNYMKLIKLLYLADRAALTKWSEPITCDSYFSLKHGPVVSKIMDLITTPQFFNEDAEWYEHIVRDDHDQYSVVLKDPIGLDELSNREIKTISEIDEAFKNYDQWKLKDFCHDTCEEWQDPDNGRIPILVEDILKAVGKTDEEILEIEEETACFNRMKTLLRAQS